MDQINHQPVILVLASGAGRRFFASGGVRHKLYTQLAGRSVLEHVLAAVEKSQLPWWLVTGVSGGMGSSIAAGVAATTEAASWLILPADLPLVSPDSLCAVAAKLIESPVVVPTWSGQNGHPVGFSRHCREQLLQLSGDEGAASVVRQFRQRGDVTDLVLEDDGIVRDVDTVEDLNRLESILIQRELAVWEEKNGKR